jgi:hypothetical protein
MAFVEITEAQIEALGIDVGATNTDDVTAAQAEQYETWAIPQVDSDFPSDLDSYLRTLAISLLVCHYAEMKQRIPKTETTEDNYVRTMAGELGETQYGQNYLSKKSLFGSRKVKFIEMRDSYLGRG